MAVPCSIFGDKKRLFDLSHNLDDQTIVWPTESKFQFCLNCCVVQLDEQKSVDATITEGNDTVTNIAISAVINTVTDTVNDTVTDTATNSVSDIVTGTFNDIIRDKVTNINNYFYSAGTFTSAEHCGTHVDAPYHFNEHGNTVDTIPINKLIASCKVIDIVEKCQTERNNTGICDYTLTVDDVLSFESVHGLLLVGEIVLVRTGWSR